MFVKQVVSKFIDLKGFVEKNISIGYSITQDPDKSVSIVFENKPKIKIYNDFKIRTPLFLIPFIGKKIIIYHDYINCAPNELFRIKPVDFRLNDMAGIRYINPYFTSTTLNIPYYYINKNLDDIAPILRISMALTNEFIVKKGEVRAEFSIVKKDDLLNYPLYRSTNGLRTKTMIKVINLLNDNDKDLENFTYVETVPVSFNKYGVMLFKERINE